MTDKFNQMPANVKVWVFASNKLIEGNFQEVIKNKLNTFLPSWTAHQNQLKATFEILYNCFIVVMLDESFNEASGCGIDKLTNQIKEIEQETALNFFNRTNIQILENNEIKIYTKSEVLNKIENNEITDEFKTFNNQVVSKEQFDSNWVISVKNAWFYPKTKLQSV